MGPLLFGWYKLGHYRLYMREPWRMHHGNGIQ
jgi:hypothetical protein